MLDYATIIRLSKQGESKNSISNTLGTKWDTLDRILKFYTNRWGAQGKKPRRCILGDNRQATIPAPYARRRGHPRNAEEGKNLQFMFKIAMTSKVRSVIFEN